MREITSSTHSPRLVFSSDGRIKMLRSGSDSCAEHNSPALYLTSKLCTAYKADASQMAVHPITQGHLVEFSELPANGTSPSDAVMGFNGSDGPFFRPSENRPLNLELIPKTVTTFSQNIAAAVAWGNFVIRVRGSALVEALAEFHRAILAGDVVLAAGNRFNGNPYGVVLLNLKVLTLDERELLETDPGAYLRTGFKT